MIAKHILLWIGLTLLSIFVTPLMVDKANYGERIKGEQAQLMRTMGDESGGQIIRQADQIYKSLFEDSGIQPWAFERYKVTASKEDELLTQTPMDKAEKNAELYIVAMFMNFYEGVFRLTQLAYWLTYAAPFLLAAAFDGIMQRKVKIATFHYSSPAVYNAMWHVMIIVIFGTMIYCDSPMPMATLSFPVLLLFVSMMIRAMLSNLQRSA